MQNIASAQEYRDERLSAVFNHLQTMQLSLSAQDYFLAVEKMIEKARTAIKTVDDPDTQKDLTQFYCQVIDYAVKLSLE